MAKGRGGGGRSNGVGAIATTVATKSSPLSSLSVIIPHKVLIRLLILLTVITIFMNILFLLPLEDASKLQSISLLPSKAVISSPHNNINTKNDNNNLQTSSSFKVEKRPELASVAVSRPSNEKENGQNVVDNENNNPFMVSFPVFTEEEGQQHIRDLFQEAEIEITPGIQSQLPTWEQVQEVVGPHPYLMGLEHCQRFRDKVPPLERMLGSAGMFNTGTNLVTHLLKQNCEIPERRKKYGAHQSKESYGMRWQVPWGKHTPAKFRSEHATEKAAASGINKEYILPVVTIRDPYMWFKSMCNNGYTAKWDHRKGQIPMHCPKLKPSTTGRWNPVTVRYADSRVDSHASLAHLWNDWYAYYINQSEFPYVAVRMEDLIFYPKETIKAVCECAGGEIVTGQNFKFITESAKADSPGHDASTGMSAAWIKYSKLPQPRHGFTVEDYEAAKEALNFTLMEKLGYKHPAAE